MQIFDIEMEGGTGGGANTVSPDGEIIESNEKQDES